MFVVPSCHYGYVDCEWYLDIRLREAIGGKFYSPDEYEMKGNQVIAGLHALPERDFHNWLGACIDFPVIAYPSVWAVIPSMQRQDTDRSSQRQCLLSVVRVTAVAQTRLSDFCLFSRRGYRCAYSRVACSPTKELLLQQTFLERQQSLRRRCLRVLLPAARLIWWV